MIEILNGSVVDFTTGHVVIMCGGVGYAVEIPRSTDQSTWISGTHLQLWIHTEIKEESITLFGFADKIDRFLFRTLRGVQGVGPKSALSICDLGIATVVNAVLQADVSALIQAKGIGQKAAREVIAKLGPQFARLDSPFHVFADHQPKAAPVVPDELKRQAVAGLVNLGTRQTTAKEAVEIAAETFSETPPLPFLICEALKHR